MDLLERMSLWARTQGEKTALSGEFAGTAETVTYAALWHRSGSIACALRSAGFGASDRIAILAEGRPLWGLSLLACWRAGAVVVPLDPRLDEADLLRQVADARPRILIASGSMKAMAVRLANALPSAARVACFDDPGDTLFALQAGHCAASSGALELLAAEHCALVVYTSGTGGAAKGVVLTHGNLRFQFEACTGLFANDERTVAVSVLPLNHMFELTVGLLCMLYIGGRVSYCPSLLPETIGATLMRERPTVMTAVPLLLALIRNGIEGALASGPRWQARLFVCLRSVARCLPSRQLRRVLFLRLHRRFGDRLRYFICGGAPLPADVARFFDDIGIAVYQGYGSTECGPVISTNAPEMNRPGSVGRPLPGVEVRCGSGTAGARGEILIRGPHVMREYLNQPELTAAAIDAEGWFHSGDLGHLDAEGYLHVSGRKDDLIVLGNGKKVMPEEVEGQLSGAAAFKELVVVGSIVRAGSQAGSREVCVVVVPSDEDRQAFPDDTAGLLRVVHRRLRERFAGLASYKRPTRLVLRMDALPRTPTRKVRRPELSAWLESLEQ